MCAAIVQGGTSRTVKIGALKEVRVGVRMRKRPTLHSSKQSSEPSREAGLCTHDLALSSLAPPRYPAVCPGAPLCALEHQLPLRTSRILWLVVTRASPCFSVPSSWKRPLPVFPCSLLLRNSHHSIIVFLILFCSPRPEAPIKAVATHSPPVNPVHGTTPDTSWCPKECAARGPEGMDCMESVTPALGSALWSLREASQRTSVCPKRRR